MANCSMVIAHGLAECAGRLNQLLSAVFLIHFKTLHRAIWSIAIRPPTLIGGENHECTMDWSSHCRPARRPSNPHFSRWARIAGSSNFLKYTAEIQNLKCIMFNVQKIEFENIKLCRLVDILKRFIGAQLRIIKNNLLFNIALVNNLREHMTTLPTLVCATGTFYWK